MLDDQTGEALMYGDDTAEALVSRLETYHTRRRCPC